MPEWYEVKKWPFLAFFADPRDVPQEPLFFGIFEKSTSKGLSQWKTASFLGVNFSKS
jgi:hypothetical protein